MLLIGQGWFHILWRGRSGYHHSLPRQFHATLRKARACSLAHCLPIECRRRLELMGRIHRCLSAEHADGSGSAGFDPKRPWNTERRLAACDSQFWKDELEDPALYVLTHTKNLSSVLDHDACAAGRSGMAVTAESNSGHSMGAAVKRLSINAASDQAGSSAKRTKGPH